MANIKECSQIVDNYLKARIPFISVRTCERSRVLDIFRKSSQEIGIPIYVHSISKGMRELIEDTQVSDDRSLPGALDFISENMPKKSNLTIILTEMPDIEDDTDTARQLMDLTLLATENGGSIVVIGNKPVWGQLQRLGMSLTLDNPDEEEILEIIKECIDPYRGSMEIQWDDTDVKKAATFLNGISKIETENIIVTLLAKGSILKEDINEVMSAKERIFSDISGLERIKVNNDILNVGGLAGLRQWLNVNSQLVTADLRGTGIKPPRGVLLVGVPGCGKSLSAKAIAVDWNLPLYRLDLSTIHGQYLGQSEGRLKEALATADHVAPCVLWIDEIEKGLAGATGGGDGGTSTRLVGQFLFWLQEATARVFIVATANDISKLPVELLRRGRFDELFFVDLPTREERREIISIYIKKGLKSEINEDLMNELVELSDGFSGADIESAVNDVAKKAYLDGFESITEDFFKKAFINVVPMTKTNPEKIEDIRNWGKERAVSASGAPIGGESPNNSSKNRGRTILM
ncbi:AAA family ATPase [Clostridium nigeriense]|uniref:AAA family ATPase n=1 Tax=Clostridium nigeriense TaxID=1805470 RepID=UPI003D33EED1